MSDSNQHLDLIAPSQASKEVTANAMFDAMSANALFGRRASTTAGLTFGYYGGKFQKTDGTIAAIANGTVSLSPSATNYLYVDSAGVVQKATVKPAGWPGPLASGAIALYEIVTGPDSVTSYTDWRAPLRGPAGAAGATGPAGPAGPTGPTGPAGPSGSVPLTTKGDLLAYGTGPDRLPAGSNGQVLTADSAQPLGVKWAASSGGGTPGGSNTQVQFNDGGALGGSSAFTWDKTNNILSIGSTTTAGSIKTPDATGSNPGTNITIQAGASGTTSGAGNKGGTLNLLAGTSGNGDGGSVNITATSGVTLSSNNPNGGSVNITAGDGSNSGLGGDVNITSGSNGGINVGRVLLRASLGGSLTTQATIQLGGVAFAGGISIAGANGKAAGLGGGPVSISGGSGGTSNMAGGAVTITGGAAGSASSGVVGGAVTITGGAGTTTTTGAAGSAVNMVGGAAGGSGNNAGGNVLLKGGAATGTGPRGNCGVDNGGALSTSAAGGFFFVPTCAGAPTGTPGNIPAGAVAVVVDTTNSKLYLYLGGAWKGVTLA